MFWSGAASGIGKFVSELPDSSRCNRKCCSSRCRFCSARYSGTSGRSSSSRSPPAQLSSPRIDPLYERWIAAPRRDAFAVSRLLQPDCRGRRRADGRCICRSKKRCRLSLGAVGVWLLLTAPMSLRSLRSTRHKLIWVACSILAPLLVWVLRAHVPPAGLAVTQAVITQSIVDRTPGPAVRTLTSAELTWRRRRLRCHSRAERCRSIHHLRVAPRRRSRTHQL